MQAYLVNTKTRKIVALYNSVEDANTAGQNSKIDYDVITDGEDLGRFTAADIVGFYNSIMPKGREMKGRFKSKSDGARRLFNALSAAGIKMSNVKVPVAKQKKAPAGTLNVHGITFQSDGIIFKIHQLAESLYKKHGKNLKRRMFLEAGLEQGYNHYTLTTQWQRWRSNRQIG